MDEHEVRDSAITAENDEVKLSAPEDAPEHTDKGHHTNSASEKQESPQLGALVQYWVDRALQFFSHASNETLGACFVGLGASTYLVLGRVGLVLIGVVGGIALHATWESSATGSALGGSAGERDAQRKRELGLEVVQRVWRWRDRRQDTDSEPDKESEDNVELKMFQGKTLDFSGFQPETAEALDVFTTAVIRDYVKWWYSPVLPDEEDFPAACRQTFMAFLLSLSGHVSRKRPTEMFMNFAINSSSIMIAFFSELSAALNASPNSDAASAIDTYMQMKPDSSLAQMLDQKAQAKKLSLVSEDILQNYLDPKAYNFPPVRVFLHQVMSKLVLGMTLESCSKPDWINGWIVYLLEDGEPEIMQVIDASVENATEKAPSTTSTQAATTEVPETSKSPDHQRHKSRAEEAMEEALQEAKRLTELIAEDESKKAQAQSEILVSSDVSEDTTQGIRTPTSSQSESERNEASRVVAEAALDLTGEAVPASAPPTIQTQQFTNFDQILPPQGPETPNSMYDEPKPILTLHNAKVSIFDDSVPGEKTVMKSKPNVDYLIQIEPADSRFPGWMIARKYMDFEVLHEVLRRISVITGVKFTELHGDLPSWKRVTKPVFRDELEKYLTDAMKYQQLAESEGMKRFLDKEQGLSKSPASGKGLGWPDPLSMGKGMMDVLAKAPKEVAGGGKAIFGGVAGVLGGGSKKSSVAPQPARTASSSSLPFSTSSPSIDRQSSDLNGRQFGGTQEAGSRESLERPSSKPLPVQELRSRASTSSQARSSIDSSSVKARVSDAVPPLEIPADLDTLNLPPPPSAIDEYETPSSSISPMAQPKSSIDTPGPTLPPRPPAETSTSASTPPRPSTDLPKTPKPSPSATPLTTQETTVTLDLLFAVISELYTLSSAWTFRRTLLQAARTYLLRPGNPQLETIRLTLQESIIDAHSSDAGVARLILKTRENSLPTEEELAAWPKELGEKESEALRVKARRLLVERGMPMALTSVMGQAASGEALGRVFDCLQVRSVARSLEFGLLLQGLRAVVQ